MSKLGAVVLAALILIGSGQAVLAGQFYLHDHELYWWYVSEEPEFSAVVPADADYYNQKRIFGQNILEIGWKDQSVVLEIGVAPQGDVAAVQKALDARWRFLVSGVEVTADREITTSGGLNAHFYSYEGRGPQGNQVMLRSVYFRRNDAVVYLAMFLNSADYQGNTREFWLRAVNEFEW